MSQKPTNQYRPQRFAFFLGGNLCLAVFMLVAILMLQSGHRGFVPHAAIDKEYVNSIIASGEAASMHKALKITEIARAGAYEDYLGMMRLVQLAAIALAVLFVMNSFFLFRLRAPLKALHRDQQAGLREGVGLGGDLGALEALHRDQEAALRRG